MNVRKAGIFGAFAGSFALGYFTDLAGLFFLGGGLISVWMLILGGTLYLCWALLSWRKWIAARPRKILFVGPVITGLVAMTGLVGSAVSASPAVLNNEQGANVSKELRYMLEHDQRDRMSGRFAFMPWRDAQRLRRTREIITGGTYELDADSKYAAAMILQHGDQASDYETAYYLASESYAAGRADSQRLAEAAYDRWQVSLGKPQRYGTQSTVRLGINGLRVDEPAP